MTASTSVDQQLQPGLLRNRSFILMLGAMGVSQLGNALYQVVIPMSILQTSGSAGYVGVLNSISTIIRLLVAPVAGAIADRSDRRAVMAAANLARALVLAALALAFWRGANRFGFLPGASVVLTLGGAFFSPAYAAALRTVMLGAGVNLAGSAFGVLLPVIAVRELELSPALYGLFQMVNPAGVAPSDGPGQRRDGMGDRTPPLRRAPLPRRVFPRPAERAADGPLAPDCLTRAAGALLRHAVLPERGADARGLRGDGVPVGLDLALLHRGRCRSPRGGPHRLGAAGPRVAGRLVTAPGSGRQAPVDQGDEVGQPRLVFPVAFMLALGLVHLVHTFA